MSGDHNQHQADQCEHLWRYIGSKRQAVWRCPHCESLRFVEPPAREWKGLTDEELKPLCDEWRIMYGAYVNVFARAIEAKLREKNSGRPIKNNDLCGND